uniref:SMC_N domain-containing protein n=1 Tax=Syphacia muris TaxID=451379 RepID=A0A0N5AI42_9BILA
DFNIPFVLAGGSFCTKIKFSLVLDENRKRNIQRQDDFKENANVRKKCRLLSQKENFCLSEDYEMKRQNQLEELNNSDISPCKRRRISERSENDSFEVAGRVTSVELENFMCHSRLKVDFDVQNNNCFYIGGPNGSGKSALFAALNIGLGGKGNLNERGNGLKEYIKDGKKRSKIRIVLTNKGSGRHPKYGTAIAVERVIGVSGSSYAIKSITSGQNGDHEETISTKKADLDGLLTRFDIQLTNPIFWMSQDRCRAFLQDMKPNKLYKVVFMFATELDCTMESYKKIESYVCDIRSTMVALKGILKQKKSEILTLNAQKEKMKNIEEKKAKLNELGYILLWVSVRDAEKKVQKKEESFIRTEETISDIEKRVSEYDASTEKLKSEEQDCTNEINLLLSETTAVKDRVEERNNEVESTKKKTSEKLILLKKKEREMKEIIAQVRSVDQVIQQTKLRAQKSKIGQTAVEKLDDELKEHCQKKKLLGVEHSKIENEFLKCKSEYEEAMSREKNKIYELRAAENNLRKARADKERHEAVSRSAVARFGVEVPSILRVIEENGQRFYKKPIGPLGLFVKVCEKRWTLAVELALSSALKCFLCDNVKDKKIFEVLLKENGIKRMPGFIITKFKDHPYNTEQYEPSENWLTVKRVVNILDINVFNALIDQTQMESILLFETDDKARSIMNTNPPNNVVKGFTLTGSEVFPSLPGKTYRFYPNMSDVKTDLLSTSSTSDAELLRANIKSMEEHFKKIQKECADAKASVCEMRQRTNELNEKLKAVSYEIEQVLLKKRSLEKKIDLQRMDEDFDNQITNLVSSKEEFLGKKDSLLTSMSELNSEIECCKKDVYDRVEEKRSVESELRSIESKLLKAKQSKNVISARLEKVQNQKKTALSDIEKLQQKRESDKLQVEEARKAYELALEDTKKSCLLLRPGRSVEPPDFTTLPDTESIRQEYNNLEQFINAAKKCLGSASMTMENLKKLVTGFQKSRQNYRQLEGLLQTLEECLRLRQEKYVIIKHATALRLSSAYSRLMLMRDFRGHLAIDHDQHVIEVIVSVVLYFHTDKIAETHPKKSVSQSKDTERSNLLKAKQLQSDLKGLSGGERTYTLACFIMALWEVMESPFRCMDEFDVFLDLNNRKLVMELLVELATHQYPHNQFIFFTPQGIAELLQRDRVQLFQLPRVRHD